MKETLVNVLALRGHNVDLSLEMLDDVLVSLNLLLSLCYTLKILLCITICGTNFLYTIFWTILYLNHE